MEKLYKYTGTISQIGFEGNGCMRADIILSDINDWDKAPVRVEAFGPLAKYLSDRSWTDAEERYIPQDWYYDRNLYLRRVEIPSKDGIPAKIITQADFLQGHLEVFGPQEYIETPEPEQMDRDQHSAWLKWRWDHC